MITLKEYFGGFEAKATDEHQQNAVKLLHSVEMLMNTLRAVGITFPYNHMTRTLISGSRYGGYRPKDCPIGAPNSAHKLGMAVDLFDPSNTIDDYLLAHQDILIEPGIYIEHPSATQGWTHWSIKPPKSGKHVFLP